MTQGGSQPNGTTPHSDHSRKTSVVINASGASGQIPNGGPVGQNGRLPINFGSMGASGSPLQQPGVPYQAPSSNMSVPPRDPRVTSPAHSPSPIPQPPASGGRPPSLQNQGNGVTFGQMGGESDSMRHTPIPLGPGMSTAHERRPSSQSMHSDMSNQGMNINRNFVPNSGRGRGFPPQQPFGQAPSPGPAFRQMTNQSGPRNMPQFPPPNSPYGRGRGSPAVPHAQPQMPHPQMGYGYPNMGPQGIYPPYHAFEGHYQPYGYPTAYYPGQPPQSPRPQYPNPYAMPQGPAMQPPFHPPEMSRNTSQSSPRPPSSLDQRTPSVQQQTPSQTPVPIQQPVPTPSSNFVRPKKGNAIKITDAQGNELNFNKASPSPGVQVQPQMPVIVSTPALTPPPPVSSNQHNRTESRSAKSAEETKNAFQEQVKLQMEEQKRKKQEEEEEAKAKAAKEEADAKSVDVQATESKEPAQDETKAASIENESAPKEDGKDESVERGSEMAEKVSEKDTSEETKHEETEEERLEREIAEMEAAEREEEERERAYNEKRRREKEEKAKRQAENDAQVDDELKRQEREAEAREEARERERAEGNDEDKSMFAQLKKSTLGPSASAPESGTETPTSEEAPSDSTVMPPPQPTQTQARPLGLQKPKPAHLKLETTKRVEPAEPTPGMQALKSARFLELKEEPKYPDGFMSPNPALSDRKGRAYDKNFLLQFQNVFKEKPSVDWDQKVKETLGADEPGTARPQSARTPGMPRQPSGRPGGPLAAPFGVMGQFSGAAPGPRTLPPGTTSDQRFAASQSGGRPGMAMPGQMGRVPSNLGMGGSAMGIPRNPSLQGMASMAGPGSPRQPSSRGGKGASRRGDRTISKRQEDEHASRMPLTANADLKPLEKSSSGWVASSIGRSVMGAATPGPDGHMQPDMVQRKVKAALNKMTPEKFDKISDQILEIASQSKTEADGRTLRQVIQLTFEKACDEAHWAGMYAQFCHKMLTAMSTEIRDETIKDKNGNPVVGGALFRKYLLNRCQEEFERGWQVNLPEKPEGDSKEAVLMSDEYYIAAAAKRHGLGLIQFIGQLYKLRMLTLRIMHECVLRLLNFEGDPDEAAVENLTTLLRTVGATMNEEEQGRQMLQLYFQRMDEVLLKSEVLGSRPKFMIMDLMDLRRAGWKSKDDAKGPKTIEQIHQEAEAARAKAEADRLKQPRGGPGGRSVAGRGDARQFSGGPPVDYNKTTVGMDDLRRLQRGASHRATGSGLGPGGNLGPGGGLGVRTGSRRGLGPPSSGNTTRTNTPPVEKKEEASTQQNAFSALASLDQSGDTAEDAASQSETASPPAARNRSKSPLAAEKAEETY